jgi:outer membrane cobalamin receptor
MIAIRKNICLITLLLFAIAAQAQTTDHPDVRNMKKREILSLSPEILANLPFEDIVFLANKLGISIDDLLEQSVTVSSKTELTTRETPGIISIITSDEIEKSGANDLADLLRTIPGIYFGYDTEGVLGIFMRGNWAHEGKVLFLIDDMELNEGMFSTVPLFNHIPAAQISHIEIIRGPGSALYGGYAELGVIRVVTKNGSFLNGTEVSATGGAFADGLSRNGVHLAHGKKIGKSDFSLQATWNKSNRASGNFTDFYGDDYDMSDGWSTAEHVQLNMKYAIGSFESNLFFNNYDVFPTGYEDQIANRFRSIMGKVKYSFQPTDNLKISPSLFYKSQTPWWMEVEDAFYKRQANQYNGSVDMIWQPAKDFQILTGGGYKFDEAKISKKDREANEETFYNDKYTLNHQTIFLYAQASYTSNIGNFFAGMRFEDHSVAGSNIAPRLGYTKVFDRFNIKYLYSHAFRSPSIENININEEIKPEKTIVNELELGYRISDHLYANISLFDIVIKDPIIYMFDEDLSDEMNPVLIDGYMNDTQTGTTGFELEIKTVYEKWNAAFSYSFYDGSRNNTSTFYDVNINNNEKASLLKGAPAHIFHLKGSAKINDKYYLTPSISYFSERYGFITNDLEQEKTNGYFLADLTCLAKNMFVKNLDLTLSLRNMFNEKHAYIQPYGMPEMVEAPYPGAPFETVLKVKYKF